MAKKRINSRQRGVRGELKVRDVFRAEGWECRRGQQHSAIAADGSAHPDLVFADKDFGYYVECKNVEKVSMRNVRDWMTKLKTECPAGLIPMLVLLQNGEEMLRITELKQDVPKKNGTSGPLVDGQN